MPRLVVTLPARSVGEAREQIELAQRAGADLAEVRFDRWPVPQRAEVGELFPSQLPLVATLRSRIEGGEGPDDPHERAPILHALAAHPFASLDLESARDDVGGIRASCGARLEIIDSTHFPTGTTRTEFLRALDAPVPPGTIRKLVIGASTGAAVAEILPHLPANDHSLTRVVHTTGASGPLLRALGKRLRLPLVYACLPENRRSDRLDAVEPSQIPVDRLHRYFAGADDAPLFAVLGHPVFHSLSPVIHDRWVVATGRSALYIPLEIASEEEFRSVMPALGERGFRGANVTHPWKGAALAFARGSSPMADECGAANCLTFTQGHWDADNTDVLAMTRRLDELRSGGMWDGERLTVIGAGGAARATLLAARNLRARTTVVARRRENAARVARDLGCEIGESGNPAPASFVVHATSAGGGSTDPLAIPLDRFLRPESYVLDWVYRPSDHQVAEAARRGGARYESGERLLVYQAASSFARWWGTPPPPDSVRAVLEEIGCAG